MITDLSKRVDSIWKDARSSTLKVTADIISEKCCHNCFLKMSQVESPKQEMFLSEEDGLVSPEDKDVLASFLKKRNFQDFNQQDRFASFKSGICLPNRDSTSKQIEAS